MTKTYPLTPPDPIPTLTYHSPEINFQNRTLLNEMSHKIITPLTSTDPCPILTSIKIFMQK
jgi:hypothetical protein